jgi:hypothetical protein
MSVYAMSVVWKSELDKAKKLILLAYADFADDDGGSIFPSIRRIAWKTGYTRRQVQRITRDLEEIGYMIPGEVNEELKTIIYKIDLAALPKLPPFESIKKSDQNKGTEGGVTITPGVIDDTDMSQITPDPSFNPLSNNNAQAREGKDEDIRSRQDYIDLQNAVVTVCFKLNIMALQEKDIKAIDQLYEMGVDPDDLRTHYGRETKNGRGPGSWWYTQNWKGTKGQVPKPPDLIETIGEALAFRPEHKTTPSNEATKAWAEVQMWLQGKMRPVDFSSPLTIQVVRVITESELKYMPENKEGFYKKRFVGLFKDLEQKQQHR